MGKVQQFYHALKDLFAPAPNESALVNVAAPAQMEKSHPPLTGRSGSLHSQLAQYNRWREWYNPLRGLDIQRAVALVEMFNRGEFADLQWLYFHIEQTDPDLFALVERRTSAIQEMDWTIKLPDVEKRRPNFDQTLADEQAAMLRECYDRIDNLGEAIDHLALASFRGFSLLEKQSLRDPWVDHLGIIDHWNVVRDGLRGDWKYNDKAQLVTFTSLDDRYLLPNDLLISREVTRHINRIALFKYIRSNMGDRDWSAFIEIYGVPSGVVTMPANVSADKIDEYEDAAVEIAQGGSGALPFGSTYTPNDQPRGVNPFKDWLSYLSEKLILAGTGGKLTMLTAAGSGTLAGNAHADTFQSIARAEGRRISEIFQKQRDKELLDLNFPGQPHLAYFELCFNEENDVGEIVTQVSTLSQAGYQVDAAQVEEKTGYKVTLKPATPQPGLPGQPGQSLPQNYNQPLTNRASDALAQSMGVSRTWIAPVEELLAELEKKAADESLSDSDVITAVEEAIKRVPELFADMDVDALAQMFFDAMAQSATEGVRESLSKTKTKP